MEALISLPQRFNLARIIPWLLAATFFALPISSTAKSITLSLSVLVIILNLEYHPVLGLIWKEKWCKAAFVLFGIAFLACFWSPAPLSDRFLVLEKYSKLLYLPILALAFQEQTTRRISLHAFLAALFCVSAIAILKFQGYLPFLNLDPDRIVHNHIIMGAMLNFAAYTAAWFAYQFSDFRRIAYGLLFCLFSYHVLFVNGGRMAYLIYFLSLFLLISQIFTWRKALVAILTVCALAVLIYSQNSFMKTRIQLLKTQYQAYEQHQGNNAVGFRLQFHTYAHILFDKHPLIGSGTSSFLYFFKKDNPGTRMGASALGTS